MGYGSKIKGRININPPFSPLKLPDGKFLEGTEKRVKFLTQEQTTSNEDSLVVEVQVIAIVPADSESFTAYTLHEDLEEMLALVVAAGSKLMPGYIYRIGAESGDITRYRLDSGYVVWGEAQLRWADGTPVEKEIYSL